jgi:hypothetical protein
VQLEWWSHGPSYQSLAELWCGRQLSSLKAERLYVDRSHNINGYRGAWPLLVVVSIEMQEARKTGRSAKAVKRAVSATAAKRWSGGWQSRSRQSHPLAVRHMHRLLLLLCIIPIAAANGAKPGQDRGDYQSKLDKENVDFLRDLAHLITAKGFTNVKVIPQMFVVTAVGPHGKPLAMIVDANTLKTFTIDNQLPGLSDAATSKPEGQLPELR